MNAVAKVSSGDIIETVMVKGDLAKLTADERNAYYVRMCEAVGVNPVTRPFEYITLNGRMVLYARKDCTDQLRKKNGISVTDLTESEREGVYVVTAKVSDHDGRTDIAKGAVNIAGVKGEALANAIMKAETKSKRRATLSICGLGMLDETEVEDIRDDGNAAGGKSYMGNPNATMAGGERRGARPDGTMSSPHDSVIETKSDNPVTPPVETPLTIKVNPREPLYLVVFIDRYVEALQKVTTKEGIDALMEANCTNLKKVTTHTDPKAKPHQERLREAVAKARTRVTGTITRVIEGDGATPHIALEVPTAGGTSGATKRGATITDPEAFLTSMYGRIAQCETLEAVDAIYERDIKQFEDQLSDLGKLDALMQRCRHRKEALKP